jgi:hypothetical protein
MFVMDVAYQEKNKDGEFQMKLPAWTTVAAWRNRTLAENMVFLDDSPSSISLVHW